MGARRSQQADSRLVGSRANRIRIYLSKCEAHHRREQKVKALNIQRKCQSEAAIKIQSITRRNFAKMKAEEMRIQLASAVEVKQTNAVLEILKYFRKTKPIANRLRITKRYANPIKSCPPEVMRV